MVLRDGQPAVDVDRQLLLRGGEQDAERHRRAVHVLVHAVHVARGLEVVPAGVEADALADQRHGLLRLGMAIAQMHDRGILVIAALRHRDECARAHLAQRFQVVFFELPAVLFGELLDALAVQAGGEFVGRLYGQRAAQQIACRLRLERGKTFGVGKTVQRDLLQRLALVSFFLVQRQRRAVHPRCIHRRLGGLLPLCLIALYHDGDAGRLFVQQQLHGLAHLRLHGKIGLAEIQHRPNDQAAVCGICSNGCVGEFLGLDTAPLEHGGQQFAMRH